MWDVLIDAIIDGAKIFPFIFLIYVLMEIIEHARNKESIERVLNGPFAPAFAGVLGAVPECGFAVMCAKLYDKGLIKIGTLIAAFISISDEGVIILLIDGAKVSDVILLIVIKIVYAVIAGTAINALLSGKDAVHVCPETDDCIECGEHHEKGLDKYFLHPLKHAVIILVYVVIINFALGAAIKYLIGEDNITEFMNRSTILQPVIASLVGLIPNCGSSIILAEAYLSGILGFSGLIAGLAANAGIGALILLKSKNTFKKAFLIIGLTYLLGVGLGYAVMGATAVLG
ncbi:MAG: arsenic efflux protein [Clostridia bacterium]|nr:arsenic efflux protein [Clostridia bacterium]